MADQDVDKKNGPVKKGECWKWFEKKCGFTSKKSEIVGWWISRMSVVTLISVIGFFIGLELTMLAIFNKSGNHQIGSTVVLVLDFFEIISCLLLFLSTCLSFEKIRNRVLCLCFIEDDSGIEDVDLDLLRKNRINRIIDTIGCSALGLIVIISFVVEIVFIFLDISSVYVLESTVVLGVVNGIELSAWVLVVVILILKEIFRVTCETNKWEVEN